jgi:hypothetical protein
MDLTNGAGPERLGAAAKEVEEDALNASNPSPVPTQSGHRRRREHLEGDGRPR